MWASPNIYRCLELGIGETGVFKKVLIMLLGKLAIELTNELDTFLTGNVSVPDFMCRVRRAAA